MRTRVFTIAVLLSLFTLISAQTTAPSDIHVKLILAENKTVYRIGEPIKLVLEFTGDRDGYLVEILPDEIQGGSDTVAISPETGVTRWADEFSDHALIGRDFFVNERLSASPSRAEIVLNDKLRFDNPGRYTVSVTTRRVTKGTIGKQSKPFVLTTNSVSFELQPMSETDEAKEVKRLSELIDSSNAQTRPAIVKQLSYLTGDPSTREKVRRFLDGQRGGLDYNITTGLFIARNRALALKLIEAGLRDASIPVTSQLLYVATRLKQLATMSPSEKPINALRVGLTPTENPRAREIQDAYVLELAAGLGKRSGPSQTTTAITIFTSLPKDPQAASVVQRETQRILVQQFDSLSAYSQEWLLNRHWDRLRDPNLLPSIKKMLAPGTGNKNTRDAAMIRLLEMAPDGARPYVIAEIRDPASTMDPKILAAFKEESLPEIDGVLIEQIRRLSRSNLNRDHVYLAFKAALLSRFATESIYQELMQFYRESTGLNQGTRAGLLAYFAKYNENEAIPLIEKAVSELRPGEYPEILSDVAEQYYSEAIGTLLKKFLETDDVRLASHAAYLLGKYGFRGDEEVLEARLKRWQDQWRNRVPEADAESLGQVERELIDALIHGNSWKFPPERVRELQLSCLTKLCKETHRVQQ